MPCPAFRQRVFSRIPFERNLSRNVTRLVKIRRQGLTPWLHHHRQMLHQLFHVDGFALWQGHALRIGGTGVGVGVTVHVAGAAGLGVLLGGGVMV
jgi:hypothetical protein